MELEQKLSLPRREVMEEILRDPEIAAAMAGPVQAIAMETTYFDTPDGSLRKKYWTLRRRLQNGVSVITLKTPSEVPHCRNEWEVRAGAVLEALPALCALGAPRELLSIASVVPLCGAAFLRRAVLLKLPGCLAELALDEGRLFGGGREEPLLELELERKEGDPAAMFTLSGRLCRDFSLKEEPRSKFSRAARLSEG